MKKKQRRKKGINFNAVFRRSDEQNKTDDQTIMNVLFCLSCVKFRGQFFYTCNISKAVRSRKINGDQWRSMMINDDQQRDQWSDHCGSLQITADRDKLTDQADQEHAGSWIRHGREYGCTIVIYYQHHASCIDNTAVTFQYIGFGLSGLENPTQQNKKGQIIRMPFFLFSMVWYFFNMFLLYMW